MASFSMGEAVGSGFRLIGREPKAVLIWLAGYLLISGASWGLMLVVSPDFMSQYTALMQTAATQPDAAQAEQLMASMSGIWAVMPIMLLVGLAVTAALLGAIYRAVLHPEARKSAYLRFGRQELWLLLSLIAWVIVSAVVYVAVILLAVLLGGIVTAGASAAGAGILGALFMIVVVIAGLVLTVGFIVRLSIGLPISFEQSRFALFEGWRATRGQGGKVLLLALVLLAIMIGLELCAIILVGMVTGLASVSGTGGLSAWFLVWTLLGSVAGLGIFVILAAPSADVYRQLKGEDLSLFS